MRAAEDGAIGQQEDYLLDEAEQWAAEGLITPEQLERLKARYGAPAADLRRAIVVRVCLATGVLLLLLGSFRLFVDLKLGPATLSAVQGALALLCLVAGLKLYRARPLERSGPALVYLAAMFYLGAVGLAGYTFDVLDRANAPWLLFLGGSVVAALGAWLRFLKLHALGVALLALAAATGLERAEVSWRWIGLSIAAALAAAGLAVKAPGYRLLYLTSGFALGAFTGFVLELTSTGSERALWAVVFTAWAAAPLLVGLKERDELLAGLGIVLLVVDIYTQFYVLFWDWAPRTVFFLVAGLLTLGFGIAYERTLHGERPTELFERLRAQLRR